MVMFYAPPMLPELQQLLHKVEYSSFSSIIYLKTKYIEHIWKYDIIKKEGRALQYYCHLEVLQSWILCIYLQKMNSYVFNRRIENWNSILKFFFYNDVLKTNWFNVRTKRSKVVRNCSPSANFLLSYFRNWKVSSAPCSAPASFD